MNIILIHLSWEMIGRENLIFKRRRSGCGLSTAYSEVSSTKIKHDLYDAAEVDGESKTSHDEIETDPCGA